MKMPRRALLAAAVLAALTVAPTAQAADAVPGEVLVRFKGNAGGSERAEARRAARVAVKRALRLESTQLLRTEPGQSVARAIAALERHGSVVRAAPNWIARASLNPDDAHFVSGSLWGLHNAGELIDGLLVGADADIDAPEAWDIEHDASNVVVAVADTGVRWDHPDLDGNIWQNPGETANGVDDGDPGGKVDDVRGWDFIDEDNDPSDLSEHGTHVAGTIAAEGNNATGIAGVAWDAQIMPVRVLDEDGVGTGAAILDGLDYAGDMGADVVNASLGGNAPTSVAPFYAEAMNHPATLYVVAAGNEANDNDGGGDDHHRYPCNTPIANLVCVGATDRQDRLAGFSNWGATSVDLAAPGVAILSTYPKVARTGFSDSFESGLTGWTTAGSTGGSWGDFKYTEEPKPYPDVFLHESPTGGDYSFAGNENLVIATVGSHDLTGRKGCVLAYDLYHEYDVEDELLVEVSVNGGPWTRRDAYTGTNDGIRREITALHADGQPAVKFRFRTDADDTLGNPPSGSGWFGSLIDNVEVTCQAAPDLTSYDHMNGTSMASPHVAGVATLLFGARPDADVSQVRGWLLTSGDPLNALAGRTVTGRRLNAHAAVLAAAGLAGGPEAVTDAAGSITETAATLKGRIDPNGTETSYQFRYGTAAAALTTQAPAVPAPAGAGTTAVPVQQPVSGLTPGRTYYFQLVAIQGGTETPGAVQSFKAAQKTPPTLTIAPPADVGTTVATLAGSVNPNGKATGVLLEWGTASGVYTSRTDTFAAGSGTQPIELGIELTELRPGTKYFFRLRATNADGESTSSEETFTTRALAGSPTPLPPAGPSGLSPVPPQGPVGPATPPASPPISVLCRRTKTGKVGCKAGSTAAVKVTVRIFRGRRVVSRGSATSLTKGRPLRMKTPRRIAKGRYKLQITVTRNGAIVTTLAKPIRL